MGAGAALVAATGPVDGSFSGELPHATSAAAARGRKRRAKHGIMVDGSGEGVLFTNGGPASPSPIPRRTGSSVPSTASTVRRGEHNLAKPNFGYQKRQKELEKKRKKEEKLKKRQERAAAPPAEGAPPPPEPAEGV
jgi:hypothetical protein